MIYNDPDDPTLDNPSLSGARPGVVPAPLADAIAESLVPSWHVAATERVRSRLQERIRRDGIADVALAAASQAAASSQPDPADAESSAPERPPEGPTGGFITLARTMAWFAGGPGVASSGAEGAPGNGGWVEMLPKAHARLLYTDGESESYMIRLEPSAWAPAHDHPAVEECLVLEGSLWQGDIFLEAGDFHVAHPGVRHGDLRTDTGALVFIRYGKPLAEYLKM